MSSFLTIRQMKSKMRIYFGQRGFWLPQSSMTADSFNKNKTKKTRQNDYEKQFVIRIIILLVINTETFRRKLNQYSLAF